MNKKLIAVAVAGIVAAPAAYSADVSVYGRVSNGLAFTENDAGENTQDMRTLGSRFGIKASSDIGNGLSGSAHYEFNTTTDNASSDSAVGKLRLGYVGVSGPFGSITVGQQWSAYYSVGGNLSQNYWSGPAPIGPGRVGETIQYSNSLGPVSLEIDARADDGGNGNGFGAGFTVTPMDNVFLGLAFDSSGDTDKETVGFAGGVNFGGINFVVGHEQGENHTDGDLGMVDVNNTVIGIGTSLTDQMSILVSYGRKEFENASGGTRDDSVFGVGGHYSLGGGVRIWGEFIAPDKGGADLPEQFLLALRIDF